MAGYFFEGFDFWGSIFLFYFPTVFLQGSISGALTLVDIATLNFSVSNGVGIMSGDALEAEL